MPLQAPPLGGRCAARGGRLWRCRRRVTLLGHHIQEMQKAIKLFLKEVKSITMGQCCCSCCCDSESSENKPLLSEESRVVNSSRSSSPHLRVIEGSPRQRQEADNSRDNSANDPVHDVPSSPHDVPPARQPHERATTVPLESYPPAPRETYRPAQGEAQGSLELSTKLEPSAQETNLPQSDKMVIFGRSMRLGESDKDPRKDQISPPINVHAQPQYNSQGSVSGSVESSNRIERFKLQQVLPVSERLEIKSPFISNIMWGSCDHDGGVLISTDGIKLTIPKGAIKNGDFVKFYLATDLYGPFKLPSHDQNNLASPYYWIGINESYSFQKPVQVEFEHFGACDLSHYQLLSCEEDDESYAMQPVNYDFTFKVQHDELSLCTFQTYHFCSYCLFHDCKFKFHNTASRIAVLYLKPENFQYLHQFSAEIWLSFLISYCLKRNEELFKKKCMKLDTHCSHIFEASCDKNSESYFDLKYDQYIDGWCVDHSQSTEIKTKEVNFYNYYTSKEALQISEEMSLFPPRFVVNVVRKTECLTDLNTSMTVTLYRVEEKRSVESIALKLFVSISAIAIKNSTSLSKDISLPSVGHHSCGKDEPTLKELVKYSRRISTHWRQIALQLAIPRHDISIIDINNSLVEDKCYDMFKTWLERSKTPLCWCHFIQALYDVKLERIAEDAKKHLERQSYENSDIVTPPQSRAVIGSPQSRVVMGPPQSREVMAPLPVITNEFDIKNDDQGGICTIKDLVRYLRKLKDIPEDDFLYFISCLLPTESAANVINDIRQSSASKEDNIKRVCKQFLKEKNPSWSKVCEALRSANSDDLAKLIEATFISV